MKSILRVIRVVLLSVLLGVSFTACGDGNGGEAQKVWGTNYQYRKQVTVSNNANSLMESGYTVETPFDILGLVGDGKAQADGDDIRVVYWDGANNMELNRLLDIDVGKVTFMTQADIPLSRSDDNYWIYYGNHGAGTPPANGNNVYLFYDDFDDNFLDSAKWVASGWNQIVEQNQQLETTNSSGTGLPNGYGWMLSQTTVSGNLLYQTDIKTTVDGWTFPSINYFRSDNTGGWGWYGYRWYFSVKDNLIRLLKGGSGPELWVSPNGANYSPDTFYRVRISFFNGNINGVITDLSTQTVVDSFSIADYSYSSGYHGADTQAYSSSVAIWDNYIIRKYMSPEPTTSLGSEEDL